MRIRQPESRITMSSDQLRASAEGSASATATRGIARDEVVVPLRSPAGSAAGRLPPPVGAHPVPRRPRAESGVPDGSAGRSVVAQFTDYFHRARLHPTPDAGALRAPPAEPSRHAAARTVMPASIGAHADELDWLLCQHIETHLTLIAAHAPDLAHPVDNVRRSVELLLKLRRR
jgi:hypothetical protein